MRTLSIVPVSAIALLMAGCVTVNTPNAEESSTPAPKAASGRFEQASEDGLTGSDRAFFAQIQDPIWTDEEPQSLIDLGHLICSKFEDGTDKTELLQAIIDGADNDGDAAVEMMYASVSSYCPDFLVGVTGPGGA